MSLAHRRHDISDELWNKIESHLPGQKGCWGGIARDNRTFINAVMWIFRTGAPWRDLSPDYGNWKNVHRRFCRWRDNGIWENLLNIFINAPDFEWLMIDSTFVKIHKAGLGAKGGNQTVSRTKGALNTKVHMAVDAYGMPVRIIVTEGSRNDCTQACELIQNMEAQHLMADKAYDTNAIIESAVNANIIPVIPSKRNRKIQREIDKYLYKLRHIIENTFQKFKEWRGIATRYAKNTKSYMAGLCLRALLMWVQIS
ncbi:IS5 family transposase [Candidatus Tisiphia endosymbiont of Xenochironomus xenolabis]|uniref:IS5 family transposase n=1 Tax=Candidatus Tisiphia endosymbiont of Xenochironomus xenolabis TaxID=3139334 RepID=UPI0035C8B395